MIARARSCLWAAFMSVLIFSGSSTMAPTFFEDGANHKDLEPRQRMLTPPFAAGLASELRIDFFPYGEDSRRLAAGRVQKRSGRAASNSAECRYPWRYHPSR